MSTEHEWPPVAVSLGLKYVGSDGLAEGMSHGVAGIYRGFPGLFCRQVIGTKPGFGYAFRVAPGLKADQLKEALPRGWRSQVRVTEGTVALRQPYSFRGPNSEQVAETFRRLGDALASFASPPNDQCESCGKGSGTFHVANGLPVYLCEPCVGARRRENEAALLAYAQLEAHPLRATLYGVAAAITGAIGWGVLGSLTGAMWVLAALVIGYLVAWAVLTGNGKVTRYAQALAVTLTLCSFFLGDVTMLALIVAKHANVALSPTIFRRVFEMYSTFAAERAGDLFFGGLCAVVGAAFGLLQLERRRPKPLKIA